MHRTFARARVLPPAHTHAASTINGTRLSHPLAWLGLIATLATSTLGCGAPAPARDASQDPIELASTDARAAETTHAGSAASASGNAARSAEPELPWLSPRHVGAAVRAHHGDFQACQALAEVESRRQDGTVTVGWLVRPDGTAGEVTVGPSTFTSRRINDCVLAVAKQVTFPRAAVPATVSWTLEFRGGSPSPMAAAALR